MNPALTTVAAGIVAAALVLPTPGDAAVRPDADLVQLATYTMDQERRIKTQLRRDVEMRDREAEQGTLKRRDFEHLRLRFEMFRTRSSR